MGRWSEESLVVVVQEVLGWRLFEMVVMSGEVGCWFGLFGSLVGWSWFRMAWFEEVRASSMVSPLWSVVGEYQRGEWALKSPVIKVFSRAVRCSRQFVMVWVSVAWWGLLVSRGGM